MKDNTPIYISGGARRNRSISAVQDRPGGRAAAPRVRELRCPVPVRSCGAPFRSEMDGARAYCHAPRADAQAGWRLDRNYLVVQTAR